MLTRIALAEPTKLLGYPTSEALVLRARAIQHLSPEPIAKFLPTFVRYVCRLCTYQEVNSLVVDLPPTRRDQFRILREWLDYSEYKNTLYRGIWYITSLTVPRYAKIAARMGIDPDELRQCYKCLSKEDVREIKARRKPTKYDKASIEQVIHAVAKYNNYLVRKRLYFFWSNDYATDAIDMVCELECHAVRIIRHYEVFGYKPKAMAALVARGLKNYVSNLAKYHGHAARNPLLSLQTRQKAKTVWYLNTRTEEVEEAVVYPDDMTQRKGRAKFLTHFTNRPAKFASAYKFYATKKDAEHALEGYQNGAGHRRATIIDLTPDTVGDWIPCVRYLDATSAATGKPLYDSVPAPTTRIIHFDRNHCVTAPNVNRFIETINGDWEVMFDAHCVKTTGRHSAELPANLLVCAARDFSGIDRDDLRDAMENAYYME